MVKLVDSNSKGRIVIQNRGANLSFTPDEAIKAIGLLHEALMLNNEGKRRKIDARK